MPSLKKADHNTGITTLLFLASAWVRVRVRFIVNSVIFKWFSGSFFMYFFAYNRVSVHILNMENSVPMS